METLVDLWSNMNALLLEAIDAKKIKLFFKMADRLKTNMFCKLDLKKKKIYSLCYK